MEPYRDDERADGPRRDTAAGGEYGRPRSGSPPRGCSECELPRRFSGTPVADPTGARVSRRRSDARSTCAPGRLHLQDCPSAGSRHQDCDDSIDRPRPGDRLGLHRVPVSPHDPGTVEVFWWGRRLGDLPRWDAATIAGPLDLDHAAHAEIPRIDDSNGCRKPSEFHLRAGGARRCRIESASEART